MSLHDIFDLGDDRYTAQVVPDAYPAQPQPRVSNWSEEDREAFCGEYTPERREAVAEQYWAERPVGFFQILHQTTCTCEYPYPVGVWDGHHPNCAAV